MNRNYSTFLKITKITLGILLCSSNKSFAQKIATGMNHSIVVCDDSIPMSWGYNGMGQLGDGTYVDKQIPVQALTASNILAVSAGLNTSLYLKSDSTVWVSGRNNYGQLGDGTTANKSTPIKINSLSGISYIAGGSHHSLFVKNDGTAWACGNNSSGRLGNGNGTDQSLPVQVIGLTNIIAADGGNSQSIFLKDDGTVYSCGYGGTTFSSGTSTPTQITSLSNVIAIAAGSSHSLFLLSDGTVWATGDNSQGQLGDNTIISKDTSIVQVSGITNCKAIAAGQDHSLFLLNDGTVWATGKNNNGQLATNNYSNSLIPIKAPNLSNIVEIATHSSFNLFLKNDGTVWSSGSNSYGQLGNNSFSMSATPVQAQNLCTVTLVNEEKLTSNYTIYPNPTKDVLNFNFSNTNIYKANIYSIYGELMDEKRINNNSSINISNYPAGIYFVVWTTTDGQLIKEKIIKN